MASVRLTMDVRDQGWQEGASLDRISELLDDGGNLLWLDIRDPGPAELELLRREFGFHELALEHVEQRHQRPRCIPFSGYCFMVVYTAEHTGDELVPQELQLFWGPNYLVTIHRGVLAVLDEARRRWQSHESRRPDGVGYLVYTLFDSLVDTYFTLQDWVGERVDATEEAILAGDRRAGGDIFKLRKQLVDIRRLTAPTGDVLAEALRRHPSLPETLRPYFADVQTTARTCSASWRPMAPCCLRRSTSTPRPGSVGSAS